MMMVAVLPEHLPDPRESPSYTDGAFVAAAERDPGDYTLQAGITILADDVARIRSQGVDHYDLRHEKTADTIVAVAGAAAAAATFAGNLMLYRHGMQMAPVQALGLEKSEVVTNGIVDIGGIAILTWIQQFYSFDRRQMSGYRPRVASFNGNTVEALLAARPYNNVGRAVLAAVVPRTEESELAVYPPGELTMQQIMALGRRTGVDGILVPHRYVGQADAGTALPTEPLTDWIRGIKGYDVKLGDGAVDEPYVYLPVVPAPEKPNLAEDRLWDLIDALAVQLPDEGLDDADLHSSDGLRSLARQLHPVIYRYADAATITKRVHPYHAEIFLAKRLSHFVLPEKADDDFTPVVGFHYASPGMAVPPERYTVSQLAAMQRPAGGQVETAGGLTTDDILPAVAELLEGLKKLDAKLEKQSRNERTPDELRDVQVAVVPRSMTVRRSGETDRLKDQLRHKLRRGARFAGALVCGAALCIVALSKADIPSGSATALDSNPGSFEIETGSGDIENMPIRWQLEDHGLGVAGRYREVLAYDFSSQVWHGEVSGAVRLPLEDEAYDPATTPHLTVRDILKIGNGASRLLAIKDGTRIAASRVTRPDGSDVDHDIYQTADGIAYIVVRDSSDTVVEISYDLVPAERRPGANKDMIIDSVTPQGNLQAQTPERMIGPGNELRATFQYDNTKALDAAIQGKTAAEMHDTLMEERIANCNATVVVMAVKHERTDGNDHIGAAGGFLVAPGDKYLRKRHAWIEDAFGVDHDFTPPVRGRTEAEAGVPPDDLQKLDDEWRDREVRYESAKPTPLPWRELELGVLAAGLALGVGGMAGRLRYTMLTARHRLAGRRLTGAQADAVIAHHVYGDLREPPDVRSVGLFPAERMQLDTLPKSVIAKFVADPRRMAPHLTRGQQRSLQRHARLMMDAI